MIFVSNIYEVDSSIQACAAEVLLEMGTVHDVMSSAAAAS